MKKIFNPAVLIGHEVLFWIYVSIMILIMLLTIFFVIKELRKKK